MKVDTTKLYSGLTNTQKSRLAFKELGRDSSKLDSILSTVENFSYSVPDRGYGARVQGLYTASLQWGFEYQKLTGFSMWGLGLLSVIDDKNRSKINDIYNEVTDNLNVLFLILHELDKSHGFDFATVLGNAECRHSIVSDGEQLFLSPVEHGRLPAIEIDRSIKDKNASTKAYYNTHMGLLRGTIDQYDKATGNQNRLEYENEELKAKILTLETKH